jgi:hypothetical protein
MSRRAGERQRRQRHRRRSTPRTGRQRGAIETRDRGYYRPAVTVEARVFEENPPVDNIYRGRQRASRPLTATITLTANGTVTPLRHAQDATGIITYTLAPTDDRHAVLA